jgi:hypothetical protein
MNKAARTVTACTSVCVAVVLACLVLVSSSTAADPGPAPAFSLAVSPARLTVGQAAVGSTQEVQVINGGTAPMPVTVEKQNFVADRTGTLLYEEDAPYSASDWVTVTPASFEVPAGKTQVVEVSITLPAQPEPGDHQLALVFLVPAGTGEGNVRVNRGISSPVFITVPGAVDSSAAVTGLDTGWFASGGSVDVDATIEDTGTVHRDFRGQAPLLLDVAGDAEPFPDFTVMRGGVRDITTTWDPPLMCVCHPSVTVVNADGSESTRSVRVVVFPIWWGLGVLAALVLALVALRLVRRRYRSQVAAAAAALARPAGAPGG